MNKKQYNNVIDWTLKHEAQAQSEDTLEATRAICTDLGVALPQGDLPQVAATLATNDYMYWHSCTMQEAQEAADNGTPAIGVSEERIVLLAATDEEQPVADTAAVMTLTENTSAYAVEGMRYYVYGGGSTSTTDYQNAYIERIVNKIQNCSDTIIPDDKKQTCMAICRYMLSNGYELAFVAGLLANIVFEGSIGKFESSNYGTNPKPDYLRYMDTEYDGENFYLNNYSGKTIMEVNVQTVWNMLNDLKTRSNNTWRIGDSRVGFGLGSIQWTFGRAYSLACLYKDKAGGSTTITTQQAISAEVSMIMNELQSTSYNWIVADWRETCSNSINSLFAANQSGSMLCEYYLVPYNTVEKARERGVRAEAIYLLFGNE